MSRPAMPTSRNCMPVLGMPAREEVEEVPTAILARERLDDDSWPTQAEVRWRGDWL